MRLLILMLMLTIMSLSISQTTFANDFAKKEIIFSEDEKSSDDEEPDCE